jgi:predicted nucleic acid-binding protein
MAVEQRIFAAGETLHAPHLIDIEVMQVLRRYEATHQVTAERASVAVTDLMDFPIRRYPHRFMLTRLWQLRNNLSAYDAAYIALAEALNAQLVTRDKRLASAPGHRAQIELI